MWFRFSVGNDVASNESNNNLNNNHGESGGPGGGVGGGDGGTEGVKPFEKFRRASFRRKSGSIKNSMPPKRSNSPHSILQSDANQNIIEEGEENPLITAKKKYNVVFEEKDVKDENGKLIYRNEVNIPINPPDNKQMKVSKEKLTEQSKKIKTKNSQKKNPNQISNNDKIISNCKEPSQNSPTKTYNFLSSFGLKSQPKSFFPLEKKQNTMFSSPKDKIDEDDDEEEDDEESCDSDSSDSCQCEEQDNDEIPQRGKNKLLLIDPKYRNNRIEKSSSKSKVPDFEKRESIKRSRSARKIMAPSSNHSNESLSKLKSSKIRDKSSTTTTAAAAASASGHHAEKRQNSNLNLQSLVKFVMNQKKYVAPDDSASIRRKSIADAVTSVMSIASSCKQMPIALKYPQSGIVADTPKENDPKGERNVVLMKKQNLQDSFRNSLRLKNASVDKKIYGNSDLKINRNESTSSRSSGNFEDEAFYSADETDNRKSVDSEKFPTIEEKSNPSLTSRMAAKINETTNAYRSRRARNKKPNILEKNEIYRKKSNERLSSSSIVRQPSDRRTDINSTSIRSNGNTSGVLNSSDLQTSLNASGITESINAVNSSVTDSSTSTIPPTGPLSGCVNNNNTVVDPVVSDLEKNEDAIRERYTHQHNKSAPVSVNRSESYKERLSNKRNRNSRRKTSDPNLSSRPKDEQSDVGLSNSNYLPSSDSSPSPRASYESLSTSTEHVGNAMTPCANTSIINHHSHQDSFHGSIGSAGSNNISFWVGNNSSIGVPSQLTRTWNFDSDNDDDDLIEVDWSSMVSADILATLTDAEKKRQEIINEIYQTERSHVRTLKLLDRLFFRNLQESGILTQDHLMLLFPPALLPLCDLHGNFEQKLKQRRLEHNHVVNHVGDLLASMFDGPAGDELRELAAQFCARQQIALEALKEKRRKDEQLQKLLNKAESHKACRRLQLKDLLPTVLQRLTKYPLLFENLYKVTVRVLPENISEAELIQHALESSKKILVDVNQAVKIAEDAHKLQNIQKKLDKSTFDKEEFKNLDLTQHKLIYDGNLTMKKIPGIQLHGLLFENMIVLLTKQDDKYSLKNLQATRNAEVNNKPINPIMSIDSETLVRQEAADKNSFFLIKTKTSQMLELRAPSSSDCKTWFKHISEAAEQYKSRSKNVTQESIDDPAIATLPHSNTKDSLELTPDRIPPQTATATVITTPLAPLLSPQSLPSGGSNDDTAVTLQNDLNELSDAKSNHDYYNINNNRLGHNDLLQANSVNRTLSTRSCGDATNNPRTDNSLSITNVTLRHTQSARQANASNNKDDFHKRDSTSIVYSNNSNDTRTLLMQSPLVQPTAIQISISPAHTAEPVLTSAERLRRLDASIKDGLLEKQKIICDMFRVPFEHFDEIVDIASMPEAPKDSADIALAAYDQIQNLTRVINDYMQVSPEQVISAVSTSICDKCNELQNSNTAPSHNLSTFIVSNNQLLNPPASPLPSPLDQSNDLPPPLPPPNKQTSHQLKKQKKQQHQQQHLSQKHEIPIKKALPPIVSVIVDDSQIHEDDDGYCEIDELRLTALPSTTISKMENASNTTSPPLPPPSGALKSLPPPPPPPLPTNMKKPLPIPESETSIEAEIPIKTEQEEPSSENIVKPQSVIIEESIPETLEDSEASNDKETSFDSENINISIDEVTSKIDDKSQQNDSEIDGNTTNDENQILEESQSPSQEVDSDQITKEDKKPDIEQVQDPVEHVKDKDDPETIVVDEVITPKMVDSSTQTASSILALKELKPIQCGPNRLQHVNSLEPQIPCLVLYNIVSALNEHISLLLPKLNERDQEREQLRKENQHLRELLNAMHEKQRSIQIEESEEKSDEEEKQDDNPEDSNKEDNSTAHAVNIEHNPDEHNELEAKE